VALGKKFVIEVFILIVAFYAIIFAWDLLYYKPNLNKAVQNTKQFISDLVTIPPDVTIPINFISFTSSQRQLTWAVGNEQAAIALDPNYQISYKAKMFRVILRNDVLIDNLKNELNLLPISLVKDVRAIDSITSMPTGSKVEFQDFTNENDGLREINVSFTDKPNYFGQVEWKFERSKLPYGLGESMSRIDPRTLFLNYPSVYLNEFPVSSILFISLSLVFIPLAIIAAIAYIGSSVLLKPLTLTKLNTMFVILGIILYPVILYAERIIAYRFFPY